MQPYPSAETSGPRLPSLRLRIAQDGESMLLVWRRSWARRARSGPALPRVEERPARRRHRWAPEAGAPPPQHQRRFEVRAQRRHVLAAVPRRILDLLAQRARRDANEHELHLRRRHVPAFARTGRDVGAIVARRVRRAVTRRTLLANPAATRRPALHVLRVYVAVVTLQRCIARRVTVLAARMLEHCAYRLECRDAGLARRRAKRRETGRMTATGGDDEDSGDARSKHEVLYVSCNGSARSRRFVRANTAFATAGAMGAVAGSPMPPICAPLAIRCTATRGISNMRNGR